MDVRTSEDFARAFARALWVIAALSLLGLVLFVILDSHVAAVRAGMFLLMTSGTALLLRRPGSLPMIGHGLIAGAVLTLLSSLWTYGLLSSMITVLPLLGPIATFTGGRRGGLLWTGVSLSLLVMAAARSSFSDAPLEISLLICSVGAVGLSSWITIAFWSVTRAQADRLQVINDDLRVSQAASQAASQAKSTFLATMSHEIRTPLNAVIGLSEMLGRRELAVADQDAVRQIQRSGSLLLSLVNDVLDMSRIESGALSLSEGPFSPVEVCEEVVDIFTSDATSRGVALVLSLPEGVPESVIGDRHRLRQVLVNLVGNALKFTSRGQITIALRVTAAGDRRALSLAVTDTGVGIPVEARARIFESFAQAEAGTARTYGGSGLGLSISARLMALMGGGLVLEWSEPGQGSRFVASLELPLAPAPIQAPTVSDGPLGARLLVVEDEPVNRRVVGIMLESLGCTFEIASNGEEALVKVADASPFDLILMDQQMPLLDGPATTRALRARGVTTPIIALTANAFAEDRQACLSAGMDDFLTKPISLGLLRETLSRQLAARS